MNRPTREPISKEHRALGQLLRRYREEAGVTTRGIEKYAPGHISNVENGHVTPSLEFVQLYIQRFGGDPGRVLDEFARVKTGAEQRRREKRTSEKPDFPPPEAIDENSDFALIRSSYQIREYETYYRLDSRGVIREMHGIRRLRANRPGVRFANARFSYPSDHRPGVITLHPVAGCDVAQLRPTQTGYLAAVLRLNRELDPSDDQPHEISFSITNSSSVRAQPIVSYNTRAPIARYSIRMFFDADLPPSAVWWHRGTDRFAGDSEPKPHQFLVPSPAGFYHWDFYNLRAECAGLAWSWP